MEPILAPTPQVDEKRYLVLVGWIETATLVENSSHTKTVLDDQLSSGQSKS